MMLALLKDGVSSAWRSLGFWLLMAVGQLILAWLAFAQLEVFQTIAPQLQANASNLSAMELVVKPSFNTALLLLLLLGPVIGMQSLAEERSSGRLAYWLASGLGISRLVFIKLLQVWLLSLLFVLTSLITLASLGLAISLDWVQFFTSALILVWIAGMVAAISVMASALSRQLSVAVILSYGILLFLWFLDSVVSRESSLADLALLQHSYRWFQGAIVASDLLYFLSISLIAFALALFVLANSVGCKHRLPQVLGTAGFLMLTLLLILSGSWGQWQLSERSRLLKQTQTVLQQLQGEVSIEVFVSPLALEYAQAKALQERFQQSDRAIHWEFIDPEKKNQIC